jgi:hypothetical protein
VAAQNGVMMCKGRSGQTYNVSLYFDDSANNPVRFSGYGKAGATSPTEWSAPEDCVLMDLCIAAASGQTTTQLLKNSQPTGDIFLNAIILASIVSRPPVRILYRKDERVGAVQIA